MSKVVLSYQFVVIFWTNFHPIPTPLCVTIRSIHLWTFLEIPKISTFPIHLWKFSGNPNISTLPRITTFVEIFWKNQKFPLFQCICGTFREIRIFPLHHELVQIGNLSETISDSGVCVILYAAKLAELSYQGVSESSLNNLALYLG